MPEEYIIPLSIDLTKIVNNVQPVVKGLNEINEAAGNSTNSMKKGFSDAAASADNAGKKIAGVTSQINNQIKSVDSLRITLQSYQAIADKATDPKRLIEYNKKVQDTQSAIDKLSNAGKKGFDDLGNQVAKSGNILTKSFSILRQVANILPGIGIAGIIAFATEPIINYISSLNIFKKTIEQSELAGNKLNEALSGKSYTNAIKDINELRINIGLAKNGFLDKEKVVNQFNETIGKTVGQVSNLNEAEASLNKNANAFIQTTLLKAAAQLALEEAAKKAFEAAQKRNETDNQALGSVDSYLLSGTKNSTNPNIRNIPAESAERRRKETSEALEKEKDSYITIAKDFQTQAAKIAKDNNFNLFGDYDKDDKKGEARSAKVVAERKKLNGQLLKLTNDYYSAEVEAIEDASTKAVAREEVNSKNRVRSLENDRDALRQRAKEFPELASQYRAVISQINKDIVQETTQSQARVQIIIKAGEEEQLKLRRQSAKDIAAVLKNDSDAQADAINERYDKIRADAKKAGTLTTQIEKQLSVQQSKDVNNVLVKQMDENLKKQQDIALSAIYARKKKEGESEKKFERDNQLAVLQVQIEFAEARRKLIESDPDKVKEVNELTEAINKMQKAIKGLKDEGKGDLFDYLGLNGDNIEKYGKAISTVGAQFASLFSALADAADERINKIEDQISAIDELIQADEEAVDREQDLANQGRANNLTSAKKQLEDDKKQKATLQKQEEEAQKKKQALQQAAIIADGIAQTSSLITAASEIFESLAGIPFVGVPLAIGLIATMFGAFTVAKVTAFNATKQTAAEGAVVGGKSHAEGGNKYVSMDNNDVNVLEIERGERIIRRAASEKHNRLLDAANKDDFSNVPLSDISLQQLLHQTGVITQLETAKKTGEYNNQLQEKANIIVVNTSGSSHLSEDILHSINKNILKMAEAKNREVYDMGDYLWIKEGNNSYKIYKEKNQ